MINLSFRLIVTALVTGKTTKKIKIMHTKENLTEVQIKSDAIICAKMFQIKSARPHLLDHLHCCTLQSLLVHALLLWHSL